MTHRYKSVSNMWWINHALKERSILKKRTFTFFLICSPQFPAPQLKCVSIFFWGRRLSKFSDIKHKEFLWHFLAFILTLSFALNKIPPKTRHLKEKKNSVIKSQHFILTFQNKLRHSYIFITLVIQKLFIFSRISRFLINWVYLN